MESFFSISETKLQRSFSALVLKDLTNSLPKYFNTICSPFLWETGFSKFQENFPLQKATRSSFYSKFYVFFQKIIVVIENALCFMWYSRPTPTFAGYPSFTRYE